MEKFSEKSLLALGECYVYGLIDPRNEQLFYIGKGTGNRVFNHEKESLENPDSEKLKLKKIEDIKKNGLEVKKIVIHSGLNDNEAFAAEAALINAFNYIRDADLKNAVSGQHAGEGVLTVEEFEKINGAEEITKKDIKHRILVIKINKLYHRGMSEKDLYDAIRGIWRVNINRVKKVEYVFGVYNSLILAVYKPTKWFICETSIDKLPRKDIIITNENKKRKFFIDENFEKGFPKDENQEFYMNKSIAKIKLNQKAQNPITYINS